MRVDSLTLLQISMYSLFSMKKRRDWIESADSNRDIQIFRDPRWGRGSETYGEDPFLMSAFVAAYIQGMQVGNYSHYLKVMKSSCAFLCSLLLFSAFVQVQLK